jgi:hypothetical protein
MISQIAQLQQLRTLRLRSRASSFSVVEMRHLLALHRSHLQWHRAEVMFDRGVSDVHLTRRAHEDHGPRVVVDARRFMSTGPEFDAIIQLLSGQEWDVLTMSLSAFQEGHVEAFWQVVHRRAPRLRELDLERSIFASSSRSIQPLENCRSLRRITLRKGEEAPGFGLDTAKILAQLP